MRQQRWIWTEASNDVKGVAFYVCEMHIFLWPPHAGLGNLCAKQLDEAVSA